MTLVALRSLEDPLFRSEAGAALFALNYAHGSTKKPSLTALMGGTTRAGRGLGGLDGAGQAGLILVELGRLTTLHLAIVVGRYAVPSRPCPCKALCCRGARENPDWAAAINWLTEYVLAQGLSGSNIRFRRALVSRHFGVRENFIALATSVGVERHTPGRHYQNIHKHLDEEERQAKHQMSVILGECGMVGDLL